MLRNTRYNFMCIQSTVPRNKHIIQTTPNVSSVSSLETSIMQKDNQKDIIKEKTFKINFNNNLKDDKKIYLLESGRALPQLPKILIENIKSSTKIENILKEFEKM